MYVVMTSYALPPSQNKKKFGLGRKGLNPYLQSQLEDCIFTNKLDRFYIHIDKFLY